MVILRDYVVSEARLKKFQELGLTTDKLYEVNSEPVNVEHKFINSVDVSSVM